MIGTVRGVLAGADGSNVLVQFGAVARTTIVLFLVLVRLLDASGAIATTMLDRQPAGRTSAARPLAPPRDRPAAVTEPAAVTNPAAATRPGAGAQP